MTREVVLADKARRDAVLDRARALVASSAARVRIQMTCSTTGRAFAGIGERDGNNVRLIGAEFSSHKRARTGGGGELLRSFNFVGAVPGWNCPHCMVATGARHAFICLCLGFGNVLHCGGKSNVEHFCACGDFGRASVNHGSISVEAAADPVMQRRAGPPGRLLSSSPAALLLTHERKGR